MKKIDLHKLDMFFDTHRHSLKFWFVLYLIGNTFDFWRKSSLDWLAHGIMALVFLYCAWCVLVFFKEGKVEATPGKMWATLPFVWRLLESVCFVYPVSLRKEEFYGKNQITFIFRPSSLHSKQYAEGFDCMYIFGFAGRSV